MKKTNEYNSPPSFIIIRGFNTYTKWLLENCQVINICLVVSYQWLMPWTLSIFQNYPPFSLQAFQCLAHPHPGKLPAVTHFLHLIAAPKMISQQYYLAWVNRRGEGKSLLDLLFLTHWCRCHSVWWNSSNSLVFHDISNDIQGIVSNFYCQLKTFDNYYLKH